MWFSCKNTKNLEKYKVAKKDSKKVVSEARANVFGGLYQSLGTKNVLTNLI